MTETSDERGAPSIDALDEHCHNLLYEMLLNDRRPVAIIGSGMSIVYGGVSWESSVRLALDYAIDRIARSQKKMEVAGKSRDPALVGKLAGMERDRVALDAFYHDEKALKSSNHKYVALELCERALNKVDALDEDSRSECLIVADRGPEVSSFRAFMTKVYRDDTFYITDLLRQRFNADGLLGKLRALTPQEVQQLASAVYSKTFIRGFLEGVDPGLEAAFDEFVADISRPLEKMGFAEYDSLPIDRRSALAFFLAGQAPETLRAALEEQINAVKRAGGQAGEDEADENDVAQEGARAFAPPRPILDPIARLREWLRVKRYMTLNFDYVLEKKLLLEDFRSTESPPYGIEQAVEKQQLIKDGETGGLTRRFADGQLASTDVYHDKAVGRLFEFALDSSDYRAQILHLHGRADRPSSMLLTDNDSNRQYRRDRSVRTSLEQALDVTLTGNPILFVGIGLSEAEITRALRELVSRGRATPHNPVFAIMAIEEEGTTGWRNQMAFYSQYGIHLIHAGAPGYWRGLPYFLKIIKLFRQRLDAECWSVPLSLAEVTGEEFPKDPFPDDVRPRVRLYDTEEQVRFSGMSGDRKILSYLAREICERKDRPNDNIIRGWRDYLDMLEAKLYTFASIEAMRDLYEGSIAYARQRRFPETRADFDADVDRQLEEFRSSTASQPTRLKEEGKAGLPYDPLLVREIMFWRQDIASLKKSPERGWRHKPVRSDWKVRHDAQAGAVVAIDDRQQAPPDKLMAEAAKRLLERGCYATFFSPLGTGKGQLLQILSQELRSSYTSYLIVNCNFAIEFDSVLSQVLMFVWQFLEKESEPPPRFNRLNELQKCLAQLKDKRLGSTPTIVIAGLERLIDRRGKSVAPELDLLLDKLIGPEFAASPFRLVILGADGCQSYIEHKFDHRFPAPDPASLKPWWQRRPKRLVNEVKWSEIAKHPVNLRERGFLGHLYTTAFQDAGGRINTVELRDQLRYAATRSTAAVQPNAAKSLAIEAVMRVVLDNWHDLAFRPGDNATPQDVALNRLRAVLDLHVLEALSFIGLPIESSVLDHLNTPGGLLDRIYCERLRKDATESKKDVQRLERCAAIGRLARFGLVLTIPPYPENRPAQGKREVCPDGLRIVLHRCAMAEMRERIGVRSGDELLSNSFSMTLSVSMPTDLTVASEDIQRELKITVGRLRGSWRDTVLEDEHPKIAELLQALRSAVNPGPKSKFDLSVIRSESLLTQLERAVKMVATDMQVNVRAAAGVIRGFFSAASLVAQMPTKDELGDGELGEFEEHRRRISHIINRLRESHRARETALDRLKKIEADRPRVPKALFAELREAIGKLPGAINQHPALYSGELIWLLNERSVIALLQGDLYEAQRGFREADRANAVLRTPLPGQAWRRIEINRALVRIERGHIAEARSKLIEIEKQIRSAPARSEEEDKRTAPLIESYIGLCDHLGGNYTMAEQRFGNAIRGLIETEQQRALAVTYVRKAALLYGLRRTPEANEIAYLGRSTAEAGRQMDILWRARLTEIRGMDAKADSAKIMTMFNQAKQYATVMELPRVGIQALRGMAEHHLKLGDLETAGIWASEAMTVAVRYGMVLQRIALRTLMGRILLARGDESGIYLLRRAVAHADRVGYQLQMDRAQEAIIEAGARRHG